MCMKKITDTIKKYKQGPIKIIDRLPVPLYNFLCIFLFLVMLLTLSQFSYSVRNLHYGSWECSTETGVITDKGHERIDYRTNHWRDITTYQNYIEVNGVWVRVDGSIYAKQNIADSLTYYRYQSHNRMYASIEKYHIWKGVLGIFLAILSAGLTDLFFSAHQKPKKQERADTKKHPLPSKGVRLADFSTEELLQICEENSHKNLEKRKNNRIFLENCVRQLQHEQKINQSFEKKNVKWEKGWFIAGWIGIIIAICGAASLLEKVFFGILR